MEAIEDLSEPQVVEKYLKAADIADRALAGVIERCVAGADVAEICNWSDDFILAELEPLYRKKRIAKGVAFPTCVSPNQFAAHFSPLGSESVVLADNDLVRIDLGVHVDGYISVVAHTLVVGTTPTAEAPLDGDRAVVTKAAYVALQAAMRVVKPGNHNSDVTAVIKKVADAFGVEALQGQLSHQMKRFVIDGNKVAITSETPESKVDDFEFAENEVYQLDVAMTTGDGKLRESDARTTVFMRDVERMYRPKLKTSRSLLADITRKHSTLPFSLRAFDERTARLGITELVRQNIVFPHPVLSARPDESVAHFKTTLLLSRTGTRAVTGIDIDLAAYATPAEAKEGDEEAAAADVELPEDITELLATPIRKRAPASGAAKKKSKKKKRRRRKKKAAAEEDEDGDDADE
eukprot:PLAT7613.2.p2 GENE.PLAT7613.2~~PLAT7613.2.p2  ORF type:complete len:424 (+),score=264.36 PLAT7613.2:53-1273(+)